MPFKMGPHNLWTCVAGDAGVYFVGCCANKLFVDHFQAHDGSEDAATAAEIHNAKQNLEACRQHYVDLAKAATAPTCDADEILYGRAGYLLGCHMLQDLLGDEAVSFERIVEVATAIVASGRMTMQSTQFPAVPALTQPQVNTPWQAHQR